ncbi:MAG: M48 family metallopeptidase [Crocinitomicaceae bacterium]|nr:M48 family metallopeptidase [Crocinitomicaceae bacterium]
MSKRTFLFGSTEIEYTLQYSERKTLGITVTPEMEVIVTAPLGTEIHKIEPKLIKRAPWIIRHLSYFLSFHPKTPKRKYVNGETHLYLGRQYLLKVNLELEESVKLKGKHIIVSTKKSTNVKLLLENWYHQQAKNKLHTIAQPLIDKFKKYKVAPSNIELRSMPKRWGSCTAKGKIILNPELIKAPKGSIEYVITHELCHLIHHDHTHKFFELQSKEMRDWGKWKLKLESLLA